MQFPRGMKSVKHDVRDFLGDNGIHSKNPWRFGFRLIQWVFPSDFAFHTNKILYVQYLTNVFHLTMRKLFLSFFFPIKSLSSLKKFKSSYFSASSCPCNAAQSNPFWIKWSGSCFSWHLFQVVGRNSVVSLIYFLSNPFQLPAIQA